MADTNGAPGRGLGARVRRGLAWSGGSELALQGMRLVVALVLARLLAPDDYGIAAMVLVFSSLVLVFSDLGLGAALVQRREITEDDRSTAYWTSVAAGIVFTLVGAAMAAPLAGFYGEPRLAPLCAAFSLTFLITSLASTHEALLVREMRFRSLQLRLVAGTFVGATLGIAVALRSHGPWAIIAQNLAETTVSSIALWFSSSWRPRLRFSPASLRSLWGFSGWLVGHRLLYYLHRHADNILVGRFVGAGALGAYTLAYNVMLVPFSRIAGPVQRVLWPAFAEIQNDRARIAAGWVRVTRVLGAVAIPALLGLVVVAPDFVHVVLGERWASTATLIQILSWVGMMQAIQILNVDILQALDRTSTVFRYTICYCTAHITAFAIGLHWGVVGVATAYAISSTFVEPALTWLTSRALGVSFWTVPRALFGVAQAGVLMAATVLVTRLLLIDAGAGALARLVVCVATGVIVYGVLCVWRVPELRAEVRAALGGRLARAPQPEAS